MTDYFSIQMKGDELRSMSGLALAHLGDAVYELLVRGYLCVHGKSTGKALHHATVALVRASKQAEFYDRLLPLLTADEQDVLRRGRNLQVHNIPHSAERADYQRATALEALFGYLYLKGEKARLNELFSALMEERNVT